MSSPDTTLRVARWARIDACLILLAVIVAACGLASTSDRSAPAALTPGSVGDVIGLAVVALVMLLIAWVAATGRVPRFFPTGARRPLQVPSRD